MQHHSLPTPVNAGYKSQGYFATTPPANLVVFVHGFMGEAVDTWSNFQDFILHTDKFKNADVVFYGYKTLRMQVNNHALELLDFLGKMHAPKQHKLIPPEFPERTYQRTVIVAHSLGAIISRRAMLYGHQKAAAWIAQTKMVLFAPAHQGARIAALAMEAAGPIMGVAAFLVRYQYPVLDELNIGSPTLQSLLSDTQAIQQTDKGAFTKAHAVVWAKREKVVQNVDFCGDPVPDQEDADHMSICKPVLNKFESPIKYVISALQ